MTTPERTESDLDTTDLARQIDEALTAASPENRRRLIIALDRVLGQASIEVVQFDGGGISFYAPNAMTIKRAARIWSKEPGTIAWIDNFRSGAIFWDVGANVGVYSLYAAVKRAARVIALEPGAANYFTLNRNIELNNLASKISAFCLCLSDRTEVGSFFMHSTTLGDALHSFGKPVDFKGKETTPAFVQGAFSVSADELTEKFGAPAPTYMKIDVDGLELQILNGARSILAKPSFVSLLVEVNLDDKEEVVATHDFAQSVGLVEDDLRVNQPVLFGGVRMKNLIFSRPLPSSSIS